MTYSRQATNEDAPPLPPSQALIRGKFGSTIPPRGCAIISHPPLMDATPYLCRFPSRVPLLGSLPSFCAIYCHGVPSPLSCCGVLLPFPPTEEEGCLSHSLSEALERQRTANDGSQHEIISSSRSEPRRSSGRASPIPPSARMLVPQPQTTFSSRLLRVVDVVARVTRTSRPDKTMP